MQSAVMTRLIFLALGMFAMGVDSYLIAGLLPGLSTTLHAPVAAVGQGVTVFDLTYVASAPIFALLLANKPARRVMLVALSVFAAGNILTAMSEGVGLYLASRIVAGLGAGLFTPIAVVSATGSGAATGRALSIVWGANSAGTVLGVPAGLWLAQRAGWQAALVVTVGLAAVAFVGLATQSLDARAPEHPSAAERLQLLSSPRVLTTLGVTLLTAVGSLGLYTYIATLSDAPSLPWRLGAWAAGGLAGSIAIGEIVDRVGRPQRTMAMILVVLVSAVAVLPQSSGLVPYFVWGAMGWATVTAQQSVLLEAYPNHGMMLVALNSAAIGLGSALGSALGGGALAAGLSARLLPYAAVVVLAGALGFQLVTSRSLKKVLA